MERLMFADLCRFAPGELDTFAFGCGALGLVFALATHFAEARFVPMRGSNASRALFVAVVLVSLTWIATPMVFPDPRDLGHECGFTLDAVFLPIYATITVFFGFLGGRGIMLGLDRNKAVRK